MAQVFATLACNLDAHILQAALPLLEAEKVEAMEWAFDTLYRQAQIPDWFWELVGAFSQAERLIGHGVYFSLFSGSWTQEQAAWLRRLKSLCKRFHFSHITEHFGFMTGEDFHKGAPLSVPYSTRVLNIGRDRLGRIQEACACPVGIENLAFAYSVEEVRRQGEFLDELLQAVEGFLILDLHNLYCQLCNFGLTADALLPLLPLQRVREIHISGGSWQPSPLAATRPIRRDTHDEAVPQQVFGLLEQALKICPNLQYVVLEQIGTSLHEPAAQAAFRADFLHMAELVADHNARTADAEVYGFLPLGKILLAQNPLTDELLARQQRELSDILENAADYASAGRLLAHSSLANSDWQLENWQPDMLATAVAIAQKWKRGWEI